ncbi:MAG: citramalate synthase [Provencibacterium sp.]|nr:citramalate synthase [Provencibacterium sp.]
MKAVEIFDSTLRDGSQSVGISFSVEDKLHIARALAQLGVPYIEAGNPASNPKDMEFFSRAGELGPLAARLVAFGSTRRRGNRAEEDPLCLRLLQAGTGFVSIFGKSSRSQASRVLGVSLEENLEMITDTVRFFCSRGRRVFYDAEHFFDGYRDDAAYSLKTLKAARDAGAERLILCDTNGGAFPEEIAAVTRAAVEIFGACVGIHCHDDMGCAVAGSLAAVAAGAVQVQGTLLGYGERCGNANLSAVIPSLQLKKGFSCLPSGQLRRLTKTARYIAGVSNFILPPQMPYIGSSAFAHKGGMHIDAVQKYTGSFEHIDPALVGNERDLLLSEQSGRTGLLLKLSAAVPGLQRDSSEAAELVELLKQMEYEGYHFESATASFELLVLRRLGRIQPFYTVELFKIIGEQSDKTSTKLSSAMVKVRVGEKTEITADEGEGPVNALDRALRKALEAFYPAVKQMRLTDYKVRVMEPEHATAAKVRVFIESADGESSWTTVGVSTDIINASFRALTDAIDYKLYRDASLRGKKEQEVKLDAPAL